MFICRRGRFMLAPDTGADGGVTVGDLTIAQEEIDKTDYKALYEKEVAERAKLKKSFDATASEIAELKKASKAKMSEEEKREAELAEERQHWQEMANQLNEIKTANVFAKQGYNENDYLELSKKLVEVGGDKSQELAEIFVEFVKKSNKNAVANAKNGMIKDSSVAPRASNTHEEQHAYAKMASENNKNSSSSQNIKEFYKKK